MAVKRTASGKKKCATTTKPISSVNPKNVTKSLIVRLKYRQATKAPTNYQSTRTIQVSRLEQLPLPILTKIVDHVLGAASVAADHWIEIRSHNLEPLKLRQHRMAYLHPGDPSWQDTIKDALYGTLNFAEIIPWHEECMSQIAMAAFRDLEALKGTSRIFRDLVSLREDGIIDKRADRWLLPELAQQVRHVEMETGLDRFLAAQAVLVSKTEMFVWVKIEEMTKREVNWVLRAMGCEEKLKSNMIGRFVRGKRLKYART